MPIVNKPVELEIKNITRRQGIKEYYKTKPEIRRLIGELVESMLTKNIIRGCIIYDLYKVKKIDKHAISVNKDVTLSGTALSILSSASELAVVVCTIGDELEKMVSNCFSQKEALKGLLLDGIASAAVDSISQQACQIIADEALSKGLQAGSPVSPGMPGFDIHEQEKLFKLVDAEKIGVRLLPSGIIIPKKSTSMIIGIGSRMIKITPAQICKRCQLNKTCAYQVC